MSRIYRNILFRTVSLSIIRIIFVLFLFIFNGCWKHQEHDIAAPEIPSYTLSGTVTDIDSGEILLGSEVTIHAVSLMYETDFYTATDTTDSLGGYTFDAIPGNYWVSAKRGRYEVYNGAMTMPHAEKRFDIQLPKVLTTQVVYQPSGYPAFQGMTWRGASLLAAVGWWQQYRRVFQGSFSQGFSAIHPSVFYRENPYFYGLAFNGVFWSCGGSSADPVIYSIDPGVGNISGETEVPYLLIDLTWDGNHLWASTKTFKILEFSQHPSILLNEYESPVRSPGGIAWDGEHIWTSATQENRIYRHDSEMTVDLTFAPIYLDEWYNPTFLDDIYYLAFDFQGNLWAGDGYALYRFTMP